MKTTNNQKQSTLTGKIISLLVMISLSVGQSVLAQNIGINSTGATPAASAMLDIAATDKGLLIPRVALTATNAAGPITSPATSLMVYNTATAGSAPNNVTPGYYYWSGSAWVTLGSAGSTGWTTTGNAGTTAGTNFVGTTDAVDFVVKTNNTEKTRVTSSGNVGIGTSSFNGTNPEKFVVDAGTTSSVNAIVGKGSINSYLQLNIQNQSAGTSASSDVVATADNGSETTNYVDMGINSSTNTSGVMGAANDAYLYNIGQNFLLGTGTAAKSMVFMTGGTTQATNERMRIDGSGNVGVGNNSPSFKFDVNGAIRTGQASTTSGSLVFSNSTNANTLTFNSGVTSSSYALTLPTAQGAVNTMLTNNGSGVLSWVTPAAATGAWSYDGNAVAANRNLGTTSNFSLPFITNNTERMRINNLGSVAIGTSTFNGTNPEKFVVDAGTTTSVNAIVGKGSINNYLQLNIQNQSAGTSASSDVVATADNGSETTNYVDMGINSSTNTSGIMGDANDAYLYNIGQDFLLGTGTAAKSLVFMTGGTSQASNERMRIDGSGNVGIGTNSIPKGAIGTAKLAIDGANGSMNGPHMQFTTASDNYPLMSFLPWTHDNSYVLFDTYWDGSTWRSSTTTGGNFRWQKSGGLLQLGYANVNTQGGAIASFSPGLILNSTGSVGIGTSTFNGTNPEKFIVDAGTTSSVNAIVGKGTINNYLQLNIQNQSNGTNASSDVVATADNGNETTNYIDMGVNGSANASGIMGAANDGYLYNMGQNLLIGTGTTGKAVVFMSGGTTQSTNERMRITGTGNVGIGNNNPSSTLSVTGSLAVAYRSGTGAYTILATDYAVINTGVAATWTMPAASGCPGRIYRLINQGTGNITLSRTVRTDSGTTSTTLVFAPGASSYEIMSDGTEWRKIN